jgi:transient receptor potential cation channel subfamily V member 5
VYWGEYPLCFAACLGQEECYRLILARNANPNNQDTNGNTVLHMLVIYQKVVRFLISISLNSFRRLLQVTFDMAYEAGADINIKNNLNLTPLTLAAKLAKTEIFFHILNIQREIYWQIGFIEVIVRFLRLI